MLTVRNGPVLGNAVRGRLCVLARLNQSVKQSKFFLVQLGIVQEGRALSLTLLNNILKVAGYFGA